MIKVGLLGIGSMGRVHLDNYIRLENEGFPIKLVAICDEDEKKFRGQFLEGNIEQGGTAYDFSLYNTYTDLDSFFDEDLDMVDIALPTFLHDELSIRAMKKGLHVLCEKPIALNSDRGVEMLRVSNETGSRLMIAHCLRFWPEYEYLKEAVASGKYGKVLAASFYRGGNEPIWSHRNWMLDPELSGGALIDLHIHDVDMIYWLFGKPQAVSAISTERYDIVSAHYRFADGKIINAQADLSLKGDVGFEMSYRVHAETATLVFKDNRLTIYPNGGEPWVYEHWGDHGYYREIKYFAQQLLNNGDIEISKPEDSLVTLRIAEAERESALQAGAFVLL